MIKEYQAPELKIKESEMPEVLNGSSVAVTYGFDVDMDASDL